MKFSQISAFIVFLFFTGWCLKANSAVQQFDKDLFYKVLKQGTIKDIDQEMALLEGTSINDRDAYLGTLLMKKAGMVKKNKDKIDLFKSGRKKLETVISSNKNNPEYRFMRLIIQEHVPKQTKYQSQIKEDSEFIKKNYASLPTNVKEIVKDYSKTSNNIHPTDF